MKIVTLFFVLLAAFSTASANTGVTLNCADQDGLNYMVTASSASSKIGIRMLGAVHSSWSERLRFTKEPIASTGSHDTLGVYFPVYKKINRGLFLAFADKNGSEMKVKTAQDLIEATKHLKKGMDTMLIFSIYAVGKDPGGPGGNIITGAYATCYLH